MEASSKQQKADATPDAKKTSIVWLDNSNDNSDANISAQQQLRAFDPDFKLMKDDAECEKHIRSEFRHSQIILIVNGGLGEKLVPRVHDLGHIIGIYVYCYNKAYHEQWASKHTKVKGVFTEFNKLKDQIQLDHFKSNISSINNQQSAGTYELDNQYIIADVSIDYLSQMKLTTKDKDEFISLCQTELKEHPQHGAILQQFQESYNSDRAFSCFRKDLNLQKMLENIFQHTDTEKIYHCRYYIHDIQNQFDKNKHTSKIDVYCGQLISDEAFQQLKSSVGKIIAFKSFLSTNLKRDVALAFISQQSAQKRVLFEIEANPQTPGVKSFIKNTSDSNDEEVLFMFASLFQINSIADGENGITIIKMALCASENYHQFKVQLNYINEEKDLIGFVQLQCNISQVRGCPEIMNNLDKLLEKYLNELSADHSDCLRCYDTLGNVTSAKGDFNSSLNWYQKSLEIIKAKSSGNDPKFADCYSKIAFVYLNKKDNKHALEAFKLALAIWKQIHGDDHPDLVYYYTQIIGIYESEENFREVLACYMQIYNIMLKHCPVDDNNFAPIYNNIGKTYVSLSQYSLALGYYQTSLKIKLKTLPDTSEPIALSYKNIGFVYKYLEDKDRARTSFEKAAEIYRKVHSSTHETVVEIEQLLQNSSSSPK